MGRLLLQLGGLKRVEVKDTSWSIWVNILISIGSILVLVVILYLIRKVCFNKQQWSPKRACLHSCADFCEVAESTNNGKSTKRRRSARDDEGLAMSTLLKGEESLSCKQRQPIESQPSTF